MHRITLILALAGLLSAPVLAADTPAAPAPTPGAARMDNLGAGGPPCKNKQGMMGQGMQGMKGGHPCAAKGGDCALHTEMSDRVRQLEKRVDALQMALEAALKK